MKKAQGIIAFCAMGFFLAAGTYSFAAPKEKSGTELTVPGSTETVQLPQEFLQIFISSTSDVQKNNFDSAISEYTKNSYAKDLFSSYRESYLAKKKGQATVSAIDSAFSEIKIQTEAYVKIQQELSASYNAYLQGIHSNLSATQLQPLLNNLKKNINVLAQCRNKTSVEVKKISDTYSSVTDYASRNDINYPLLMLKFTGGLKGAETSGILGTMNAHFDYVLETLGKELANAAEDDFKKIQASLPRSKITSYAADFSEANKTFSHCEIYVQQAQELNALFESENGTLTSPAYSNYSKWNTSFDSALSFIKETKAFLEAASSTSIEINRIQNLQKGENPVDDFRNGTESYSSTMVKAAALFSDTGKKATAAKNVSWLSTYNSLPSEMKKWEAGKETYLLICNELINATSTQATKVWILLANYYSDTSSEMISRANAVTEGYSKDKSHPSKSIVLLDNLLEDLNTDISLVQKFQSFLEDGYQYRSNFAQQKKDIIQSEETLKTLRQSSTSLRAEALTLKNASLAAKSQIDLYYNQAISSFNSGEYSVAHTKLDRANASYTQLLEELKKDVDIQEEVYKKLLALRQDFIERERPILISEVRNYKNSAKNFYYAGEFEQANAILTKAETRRNEWAKLMDTTLDTDEELQRIKEMVNTALSIKEGRIIYPEDPLYAEMSQLRSIAVTWFNKGKESLEKGDRSEGEKYLNLSKTKVNEIKLIYPRNQEASLLSLRIDQLLDTQAFDNMFNEKVNSLKKVNYTLKDTLAMDSYNDMLDLYEINPTFAGLKAMISSVEIDLGIRQKPVSNTNIQKAQTLAQEAKKILDSAGRDETLLSQAKSKANEAIALNQNNDLAIQVLDEIALRSGSTAAVVLSAADEEKYQAAVKDLQMNNVFSAKQKIDELLKNPVNKRSAKILKLQKRVEALL